MPESCCFVGCTNRRYKGSGKRFFRVPADPVQRQRWISAINRKHWMPTIHTRVCSDHFNAGAPSKDLRHPDFAPSQCSIKKDSASSVNQSFARLYRAQTRCRHTSLMNVAKNSSMCNLKYPVLRLQKCDATKSVQSNVQMQHTGVEIQASTPLIHSGDLVCSHSMLHSENPPTSTYLIPVGSNVSDSIEDQPTADLSVISGNSNSSDTAGMEVSLHTDYLEQQSPQPLVQLTNYCPDQCQHYSVPNVVPAVPAQNIHMHLLQRENQELRSQLEAHEKSVPLNASNFTANFIKDNDVKTSYYTGLPTYSVFCTLFHLLKDYACPPPMPESKGMTEFFAVLAKLRLDLPMTDLSYRLDLSLCRYSSIFHKWLDVMYNNLSQLVQWPDTETLKANLPISFQKHYSSVKCIIDCFEVFIERPESFTARAATYSNYKKHNTAKIFIAVSPTGFIIFISKAWGGRVSDKVITQECGFLDHIERGDVILADRGFNIADDLAIRGAKLEIPSFTKGKKQLSRMEVERSRQISRVRIHVERVIGLLRNKYRILQGTLPISLIKRPSDSTPTIDKMLIVCAGLTNLSKPIV